MILYHAISTYQLLEMILYRLKNSTKDESILMVTDTIKSKFPDLEVYSELFKEVWVYDINLTFPKGKSFSRVIDEYFNEFFKSRGTNIHEFEKVNVACTHYYFGHYLVQNQVKFTFFEDAAGMLSRPDILVNMEKDKRPFKCKKNIEFGLYTGENEFIESRVCNMSAQESNVLDECNNLEDFNVIQELMSLKEETKRFVLSLFGVTDSLSITNDVSLILTQHFANLGILSFEEQKEIYKLFVDYFFGGRRILVKTHPDDVMYYNALIDNCEIIKERFPSEFLPLLINNKVKEIATISSTSIKNYYGCNYNLFELNTDFEKTFYSIHQYYVALKLCDYFKKNYNTYGCDDTLLHNLVERNKNELCVERGDNILIVDDYLNLRFRDEKMEYNEAFLKSIEKMINETKYELIIFVNSKKHFSFFYKNRDVFKSIIKLDIEIESKEKKEWWEMTSNFSGDEKKSIYVYIKNEKLREGIMQFTMKKELENSKEIVRVDSLSDYERKAYEGQIEALEERLRYYIELHEDKDER